MSALTNYPGYIVAVSLEDVAIVDVYTMTVKSSFKL
jgi:hypothetical protein